MIGELTDTFGFTGHAGIVSGADRVLVASKYGTYPLQHAGGVKLHKPANDSVVGRVILARKTDAEVLEQLGYRSIDDTCNGVRGDVLLENIAAVRGLPVVYVKDFATPGISSIVTSVSDPGNGEVIGFSLSYPSAAADAKLSKRMIEEVESHAREIGRQVRDPAWTKVLEASRPNQVHSVR
ncbi:IclR family transcriptional regulator C-terminal domain-containing protein [Burkholderia sp. Bp9015]|uniref:IclR family transcriptional regulator domain-containing protein n=1 Tax=Burkholderia sp. Bp9015 TaxID=2184563 RepID=UPI001625DA2F|nr:IclR family transcriptional regulator C-terminal domain-containing protein [Burkholderia sp. Bp9015]